MKLSKILLSVAVLLSFGFNQSYAMDLEKEFNRHAMSVEKEELEETQ